MSNASADLYLVSEEGQDLNIVLLNRKEWTLQSRETKTQKFIRLTKELEELRAHFTPKTWKDLEPGQTFLFLNRTGVCLRLEEYAYAWIETGELHTDATSLHNDYPVLLCDMNGKLLED